MIRSVRSLSKIATIDVGRVARDLLLNVVPSSRIVPTFTRFVLYRALGIDCKRSRIYPGVYFGSTNVSIGKNAMINRDCFVEATAKTSIGANVHLGMRVLLCTSTHSMGPGQRRAGFPVAKPITIENGCWIGTGSTILPGVSIGAGTIVAAGSVVTRDCLPNSLYAGVPAAFKRCLAEEERPSHSSSGRL